MEGGKSFRKKRSRRKFKKNKTNNYNLSLEKFYTVLKNEENRDNYENVKMQYLTCMREKYCIIVLLFTVYFRHHSFSVINRIAQFNFVYIIKCTSFDRFDEFSLRHC